MSRIAVVLAAGQGTRMRSDFPKVLHPLAGRPMLAWVLEAVEAGKCDRIVVVVGHGADEVRATLPEGVEAVVQEPQLGTGHAVQVALAAIGELDPDATVLVCPGDMPLVPPDLYRRLADERGERAALLAAARLPDPHGYGRIVRDPQGRVERIVEERDCTPEELEITELNAGIYAFQAGALDQALRSVGSDNAQGEAYLTDVAGILAAAGREIGVVETDPELLLGVNSQDHLAEVARAVRGRLNRDWMLRGVRMVDPDRVYLDHDVTLAPGVVLYPGVHLESGTEVGEGAVLGPDVFASASRVGPGARVWYSVLRGAEVGEEVEVGPFASLRPGTRLERGSKAGTFVEMKKAVVGEGAKVPHLTYLGDATVGPGANVGAGTIAANYDGHAKHETRIGAKAFIGSNSVLVAPVTVGEGAITAAGSAITDDVEPGALGIARGRQRNIEGFAARFAARYRSPQPDDEGTG